jgi:hypothetical protein
MMTFEILTKPPHYCITPRQHCLCAKRDSDALINAAASNYLAVLSLLFLGYCHVHHRLFHLGNSSVTIQTPKTTAVFFG